MSMRVIGIDFERGAIRIVGFFGASQPPVKLRSLQQQARTRQVNRANALQGGEGFKPSFLRCQNLCFKVMRPVQAETG